MSARDPDHTHSVVVVTDEKGEIVATAQRQSHSSDDAPAGIEIRPRFGQRVHTVQLPAELARLSLRERTTQLHEAYRVGPNGKLHRVAEHEPEPRRP
jgi:hypothetical protein